MTDHPALRTKVLEELERTGYPTEIVTAHILQRRGWVVTHNPPYLDDATEQSREYDIRGVRAWPAGPVAHDQATADFLVFPEFIIECKKSEKPWVFFMTDEAHRDPYIGRLLRTAHQLQPPRLFWSNDTRQPPFFSDDQLRAWHRYFKTDKRARTYYEPLKKQQQSDYSPMVHAAATTAIKALLYRMGKGPGWNSLRVFYPVIVFSGDLFAAWVDDEKHVTLEPADYIQLSHWYALPKMPAAPVQHEQEREFIIEIVHERHLGAFFELVEAEHAALTEQLQRGLASGHLAIRPR